MTKISPLSLVAVVVMAMKTRVRACVGYRGARQYSGGRDRD